MHSRVRSPTCFLSRVRDTREVSKSRLSGVVIVRLIVASLLAISTVQSSPPVLWSGSSGQLSRTTAAMADVCVIGGAWSDALITSKRPGQQWLARLNPLDLSDASVRALAEKAQVPMIATVKGGLRFDLSDGAWAKFVARDVLMPALRGVGDGWVLEGFDESQLDAARTLVRQIATAHPDKRVLIAGPVGFALQEKNCGVFVEGKDAEALDAIKRVTAEGRSVIASIHGDPLQPQANAKRYAALVDAGAVASVTSSYGRVMLAPLHERSRRVLVLYGWDEKEAEKPATVPVDTLMQELLQTPVEWLGYEADYRAVTSPLPEQVAGQWAAIIVDGETQVPGPQELRVAEWLVKAKRDGLRVLFTGGLPFAREDALRVIRDGFGLRGSLALQNGELRDLTLTSARAGITGFEDRLVPHRDHYRDLVAPEGANVFIALSARNEDGRQVKFTPAFLASWGGMWLDPYVVVRASQDNSSFLIDPYALLTKFFEPCGVLPSPDTTTRDGRRLFYSHIDGDGFASPSDFKGHPLCAEMVRDRILKVFPVPVTVSVVEADVRAWSEGLDDDQQSRIQETARSIFALPQVQAASHSFSHPYLWDPHDPNPGIYTEPNLPLKPVAKYPDIVLDREIRGSVDYINRELLPPGRKVELFLWSGNCRPGPDALRLLDEMGMENMNGGDTIVSRLYPGIGGIAPRVTPWGDGLQINAANQNEFMYANGWQGPFYGGFAKVIDTFERTGEPRRLKPVNVYYHFYSAMNLSSLRALEKIHRWCMDQPLHPVTALQFAQQTRDAWRTRLFETGPRRWLIANDGHCRTFRLPKSAGVPDMPKCAGITGWSEHGGSIYVSTSGQARTELVLTDARAMPLVASEAHLYLQSSDAEIDFTKLEAWRCEFSVRSEAEAEVGFGGLPAGATGQVFINNEPRTVTTDERGFVTLSLPRTARVRLEFDRSRHVSSR